MRLWPAIGGNLTKRNDKLGSIITGGLCGTNTHCRILLGLLYCLILLTIWTNGKSLYYYSQRGILPSCIMAHILRTKKDNAHYLILESMSEESISLNRESKLDEGTVVVDGNSMWAEPDITTFGPKHTFPGVQVVSVFSLWASRDWVYERHLTLRKSLHS